MLNVVNFLTGFNSHLELNFIFYMFAKLINNKFKK